MITQNEMLAEIAGVGIGVIQTPILRVYADPKYGVLVPQLGKFGTPSALGGIVAGALALGTAYFLNKRGKLTDVQASGLETYGAAALVGGVMSGVYPAIAVGTTAMEPSIQMAARPFVPPLSPSYNRMDLDAVAKMSAEINRLTGVVNTLASEKAQLVNTLQTVSSKQKAYSFMDPTMQAMVPPGQPMPGARRIGFMVDGMPPIAKIQAMKDRYNFLG